MSSWLEAIVTEKLADALAYETAKHHEIKPEPELLLAVSENGSNLKVKLDLPTVELRVLKVGDLSSMSPENDCLFRQSILSSPANLLILTMPG